MSELTAEQKQRYIESTFSHCPYCQSDNIEGKPVEVDADTANQEVYCADCEQSWRDLYVLVDVEAI